MGLGEGGCGGGGGGGGRGTYRQVTLYECNYSVASKEPASGRFFSSFLFLVLSSSSGSEELSLLSTSEKQGLPNWGQGP